MAVGSFPDGAGILPTSSPSGPTMRHLLLLLLLSLTLAACGHKGPLYLPPDNPSGESR